MKSIYSILAICLFLGFGFIACTEDELQKDGTSGDGKTLKITISTDPSRVLNPMTKTTKADTEAINNLCILIYDIDGNIVQEESRYYSTNGDTEGLDDLSKPGTKDVISSHTYTLSVQPGAKTVYLLSNTGDVRNSLTNKSAIETYSLGLNGTKPALVMYAAGQTFNTGEGPAHIEAQLVRIYSMLTVQVVTTDEKGASLLNGNLQIVPISLQLKHIPSRGYVVGNGTVKVDDGMKTVNKIDGTNVTCVEDGERIEADGNQNFLLVDHAQATPLFLYENMQGDGNNTGEFKNNQAYKTPPSIYEATKDREVSGKDKTCSYIEMVALYSGRDGGLQGDKIVYRFFLGEDACNNFNVERNCYYKLTLTLAGDGGADEASWRVTKEFIGQIEVSDAYVGYLADSETYVSAVGDIDKITNIAIIDNPIVNNVELFSIIKSENVGNNKRTYLKVSKNNTHDFKTKSCTVVYTMNDGRTYKAKVTQVPRLVDPIAIYKPAKGPASISEVTVDVKEFIYEGSKDGYYTLNSIGPWSATIKSSPGEWFRISNGNETISKEGDSFNGLSSDVKFTYKPLSENSGNVPRVGIILVKYHNEQCVHEIVLRQGHQDTKLGNATWNMYNCIGVDGNGSVQMTKFPTQTGWLFRGCSNVGMHPFNPGWMIYNQKIELSNGQSAKFENVPVNTTNNWSNYNPCPANYTVASSNDYISLANSAYAITGYVHDDDPNSGYTREGAQLKLDKTNSCNPAKGMLFVSKTGEPVSLFLTFGKGVLTSHPEAGYIDEVGVGHRGVESGAMKYTGTLNYSEWTVPQKGNKAYGALYWTSSPGLGAYHLGKADFWYNQFTKKILIDDPSNAGFDGRHHGNFVRCVRK